MLVILVTFCSPLHAQGLSGRANVNFNSTRQLEDGERKAVSDTLNQNYYLNIEKSVTPMISYQLYLRARLSDSDLTDAENQTTKTYLRSVEPAIDLSLRNPLYDLTAGYRINEQWSTAHLENDSRETTEYYYSRMNMTPLELPSLSLQFERRKDYDHFPVKETDRTSTTYSGSSSYELPTKDLKLNYHLTYTRNVNETPIKTINKTMDDNFIGAYNVGYSAMFWDGKGTFSTGYQGNYMRNKNRQFVTQEGSVLFERTPYFGGLHSQDTTPETDALTAEPLLVNGNYKDNTGIQLNSTFQNIGVWIALKTADRIHIYYKNDGVAGPVTWRVYRSSNNLNWTFMTETTVTPAFDSVKNAYRYEIIFPAASDSYFKAVNINTVSQVDGSDVEITEISVYGTDVVPQTGILTDVSEFYSQQLNIFSDLTPVPKLIFSMNYSINRADQGLVSLLDSISGMFANIINKTTGGEEDIQSNIIRNYGAASTWTVHPMLSATLRFQRGEQFDNTEKTDTASNAYSLSIASSPMPTLDTNLSLIKSDKYSFAEKESTNKSLLINIDSRLYENVNMITDILYARTISYVTEEETTISSISGLVDAVLTRKLSADLRYNVSRTVSEDRPSISKEGALSVIFRPGRFINFSVNLGVSDKDGDTSIAEGISADWLPLPVIRLHMNYLHSSAEPGPSTSDSISGYGMWYITKFLSLQFTQGYTRKVEEKMTEDYNISANVNCRF